MQCPDFRFMSLLNALHLLLVFLLQVPHLLGMSLLKEGELLVVVFQLGGEPGHFRVEVREGCI